MLSLLLVGFSVLFFLYSMKQGDHEHADRLSLMPLEEDEAPSRDSSTRDKKTQGEAAAGSDPDRQDPPSSETRAPTD